MKQKLDGGPAFPVSSHGLNLDGMSLRDYFAAKAMAATVNDKWSSEEAIAAWAYCVADAMLKERNK
jgi:hypothetical protein